MNLELISVNKPVAFLLCGLALLACGIRFYPVLDLPFDGGHESMLDGRYYGGIQKGWLRDGLIAEGGRPRLTPIPSTPMEGEIYANHPPLAHYVLRLFICLGGLRESSFRAMGFVSTSLSLIALMLLCGKVLGAKGALGAAATFLSLPVTLHHGMSASYAPLILLLGLLSLGSIPNEDAPGGRWLLCVLTLFMAAMVDWAALFYLPGFILVAKQRSVPFMKAALLATLALGLGFLTYFLLLSSWEGGFLEAFSALRKSGGNAMSLATLTVPGFIDQQIGHWISTLGSPLAIITALGGLRSLGRMTRPQASILDALQSSFFIAAFLKMMFFPVQAYHHDFWWYSLVVCATISGAQLLSFLLRLNTLLGAIVILGLLAYGHHVTQERIDTEYQGRALKIAAAINSRLGSDCLILMTGEITPVTFYLDGWAIDGIRAPGEVENYYLRWLKGELPQSRFALICPRAFEDEILASKKWTPPPSMKREVRGNTVFTWIDRLP